MYHVIVKFVPFTRTHTKGHSFFCTLDQTKYILVVIVCLSTFRMKLDNLGQNIYLDETI